MSQHRNRRAQSLLTGLLALALASCPEPNRTPDGGAAPEPDGGAPGRGYEKTIAAMRAEILRRQAGEGIPAVSIALVDAEEEGAARVVWAEGFGLADLDRQVAATSKTLYCIGSVSKALGAALALKVVDQGKLGLDEKLSTYVAGFKMLERYPGIGQDDQMTIRRLLDHHSGVPGDLNNGLFVHTPGYYDQYLAFVLGYLAAHSPSHPPGALASYSNTGIVLAAHASFLQGRSDADADYPAFMKRALFGPLGMTSSTADPLADGTADVASSYSVSQVPGGDGGLAFAYAPFPTIIANAAATGGVYSTVEDMARFLLMLLSDGQAPDGAQYLKPETVREMGKRAATEIDFAFSTGLGLDFTSLPDFVSVAPDQAGYGRAWAKNGSTGTFNAQFIVLPDPGLKLGVVVLTNSDGATTAATEIAKDALKEAVKEKKGLAQVDPPQAPAYPGALTDPAAVAGTYSSPAGYFQVSQSDAGLAWGSHPLAPKGDGSGRFTVGSPQPMEVVFVDRKDLYGNDYRLAVKVGAGVQGEKLTGPAGATAEWRARAAGTWLLEDSFSLSLGMGAWLNLREENGLLLVSNSDGSQLLFPQSATLAYVGGYSNRRGSSVTAFDDGGRPRLEYSAETFFPMSEVAAHAPGAQETVMLEKRALQPLSVWRRVVVAASDPNVGKVLKLRVSPDDPGSVYYLLAYDEASKTMSHVAVAYGAGGLSRTLAEGTWYLAFVPSVFATGTVTLSSQLE